MRERRERERERENVHNPILQIAILIEIKSDKSIDGQIRLGRGQVNVSVDSKVYQTNKQLVTQIVKLKDEKRWIDSWIGKQIDKREKRREEQAEKIQ